MSESNERVIKSFVWHGNKCFFVSTIERDSSAVHAGPSRYNETMVWDYNWEKHERGAWLYQEEDFRGSILKHISVVTELRRDGCLKESEATA